MRISDWSSDVCSSDLDELLHGEGVAAGMVMAFDLSVQRGHCAPDDADRLRRHLAAVGLPTGFADLAPRHWDVERLIGHMSRDKKVSDGRITFVLRSEEQTSELQSLMRNSYAVFCLTKHNQ